MSPIVTPSVPHPRGVGLWSEEAPSSHRTRGSQFFGPTKARGCVLCTGLWGERLFFFFLAWVILGLLDSRTESVACSSSPGNAPGDSLVPWPQLGRSPKLFPLVLQSVSWEVHSLDWESLGGWEVTLYHDSRPFGGPIVSHRSICTPWDRGCAQGS